VTAAYAFLVLIITHTYTANLAAFLTVKQLDTSISSVRDLQGKSVASLPTYVERLYTNQRIHATATDGAAPLHAGHACMARLSV
jgi:ABC-type amino acid transport substrate-binding protein